MSDDDGLPLVVTYEDIELAGTPEEQKLIEEIDR